MIFYFSGTGNSLFAADSIAKTQGEKLLSIAKEFEKYEEEINYDCADDEIIGFIFPVYAWAPPKIVLDFIDRLKLTGKNRYIFSLCTCGDEEGLSSKIIQQALAKRGLILNSAFGIKMPNNYVLGFDVDTKEVEQNKLMAAEHKMIEINKVLANRKKDFFDLIPGKMAAFKSTLINPMFNRFSMNTKKFYATDACTSCGLCQRICPVHTITVENKTKPTWGRSCTQCLACINRCPVKAIQYGKATEKKGRYIHPILKKISI